MSLRGHESSVVGMSPGHSQDVKKRFGEAVRSHRLRCGLTQEKLARRAHLHRAYISDVERGARNLSLDAMHRLATAMETSIADLFREEEKDSAKTE